MLWTLSFELDKFQQMHFHTQFEFGTHLIITLLHVNLAT